MEPDSPCFLTLITKLQSHFGVPILQNYVFVSAIKSHNSGHLISYKLVALSVQFATNLADAISDLRLACSAGVFWGGPNLVHCVRIVGAAIFDFTTEEDWGE